ncbi:MAG: helix-turn-helix transcriptional regulator [Spirochaetes bacterium]|nr:helix-turn-helix transcriptional regulator [Spirochaetota bacterium]
MNDAVKQFLKKLPPESSFVLYSIPGSSHKPLAAGIFRAPDGLVTVDTFREYRFLYVLSGTGDYHDGTGKRRKLEPGSIVHRRPGLKHTIRRHTSSPWVDFFVTLPGPLFAPLSRYRFITDADVPVPPDAVLLGRIGSFLGSMRRSSAASVLEGFCSLIAVLRASYEARPKTRNEELVDAACTLLSEAPVNRVSIPDIAAELMTGYETFRKEFKRIVGVSPHEYHIRKKIEQAQAFLATGMTAREACGNLGYPDQFSFSKQFKRYTGMTPAEFRKRQRV